MTTKKFLTALPVYNEVNHVAEVLDEVRKFSEHILVVDDGSSDGTPQLVQDYEGIRVVTHVENQGYGAALSTAFRYAAEHEFDFVVTIDCDGQHAPQRIPEFVSAFTEGVDIVSGSRYLQKFEGDSEPPEERQRVNKLVTAILNQQLGLNLTDAFCGFKAYRVEKLSQLCISETGYAMPLELWVRAVQEGLHIIEMPVPLIYLDEDRSFGESLDDAQVRLDYYRRVIDKSLHGCSGRAPIPETIHKESA